MEEKQPRAVPIVRVLRDNVPFLYSDGFLIQHKDGMFVLTFLQTKYPLAVTPEEIDQIESVEAHGLVQILLTPEHLKRNIEAMQENLQKFGEKLNATIKEDKEQ